MASRSLGSVRDYVLDFLGRERAEESPEHALIEAFVTRRDPAAFEAIVARHGPMVLGVCRRLLRQEQDVEDAFQATFLILARKASAIRKRGSLAAWLHGVARRVTCRARVEAARRRLHEREAVSQVGTDLQQEVALRELRRLIDEEIDRLPETYRAPVVLCHLEGRTNEEAARLLGSPVGSVKGWLSRARELLRDRLTRRGLGLSGAAVGTLLSAASADAAVPAALATETVRSAIEFTAAATTPAGKVTNPAVRLAEGVMQTMFATRFAPAVLLVLVLGLLGTGAAVLAGRGAAPPNGPEKRPETPRQTEKKAAEVKQPEDPLPPGAVARLGSIRFRTSHRVQWLAYSPDGKVLAASCENDRVQLWEAETGKVLRSIPGNVWQMHNAPFTSDGKGFLTQRKHGSVVLSESATGKELARFVGHAGTVWFAALSHEGKTLATSGTDRTVRLWELATGKELHKVENYADVTEAGFFLKDNKTLGVFRDRKELHLFEPATGKTVRRFNCVEQNEQVRFTAISPDGSLFVPILTDRATVWQTETGKRLTTLSWPGRTITALTFSPDQKKLAVTLDADTFILLDTTTWKEERTFTAPGLSNTFHLTFTPDGKTLAATSAERMNVVRLWDVATGKERTPSLSNGHQEAVATLLFSPDGKTLLSDSHGEQMLRFWDVAGGKEVRQLTGVMASAVTPDGKSLLVRTHEDQRDGLHLVEAEGGKVRRRFEGRSGHISPDGRLVAVLDGWEAAIFELATGKELHRFRREKSMFHHVAFSPDGKLLAGSAGAYVPRAGDGLPAEVRLWDVSSGREVRRFGGDLFAFTPDGRGLVVSDGMQLGLWEAASGKELWRTVKAPKDRGYLPAGFLAVSPDGRLIAAGNFDETGQNLWLWELYTGQPIVPVEGHLAKINAAAFSPDSRLLATGGEDTTVLLWDLAVATGRKLPARAEITGEELDAAWADLEGLDARKAYRAIGILAASPGRSVAFLKDRLKAATAPDGERFRTLITDLDSADFTRREKATRGLQEMGSASEAALREVLAGNVSVEVRKRVEGVLRDMEARPRRLAGWELRQLRAVQALEQIATRGAVEALRIVAKGWTDSQLTREAKAALDRLGVGP